jgi:hypothetical protein
MRKPGFTTTHLPAIVLWLLTALCSPLVADAAGGQTGNVSGTVIDAQTKAPVVGAAVTLAAPSGTYAAKTDGRGFFSILGVSVDTYRLSVERQGYETLMQSGVTVIGDQTLELGSVALQKHLRTIGSRRRPWIPSPSAARACCRRPARRRRRTSRA